jgi:hypothetical protein
MEVVGARDGLLRGPVEPHLVHSAAVTDPLVDLDEVPAAVVGERHAVRGSTLQDLDLVAGRVARIGDEVEPVVGAHG